jgi:hypothetical protein
MAKRLCLCKKCIEAQPGGRYIPKRSFYRHRERGFQGFAANRMFLCQSCSAYPNGHQVNRATFYRHLSRATQLQNGETNKTSPENEDSGDTLSLHSMEDLLCGSGDYEHYDSSRGQNSDISSSDDSEGSEDDDDDDASESYNRLRAALEEVATTEDMVLENEEVLDELFSPYGGYTFFRSPLFLYLEPILIFTLLILIAEQPDDSLLLFLRLAEWADSVSRDAYTQLRHILRDLDIQLPSLRCREARLRGVTGIQHRAIDCCFNSCIAITGKYSDAQECPFCNEPRKHPTSDRPRKQFIYIPLAPRLRLQYKNAERARVLKSYRQDLLQSNEANGIRQFRDVFDGDLFRNFHQDELGLFQDPHDIALHLSLDGVQLTALKHHEVSNN